MPSLDETIDLVYVAHQGQRDKGGNDYAAHPIAVMRMVQAHLETLPEGYLTQEEKEDILHAALGHDFFEDTDINADILAQMGYRPAVAQRIEILTRRKETGLTYMQKIEQIAETGDIGVILIKYYDNKHNSDPARIAQLPEGERDISRRYARSMSVLWSAYERIMGTLMNTIASAP